MSSDLQTNDDGLIMRNMHSGTETKLHYLKRCQFLFSQSMKKKFIHLNYIDLLAGPGKHQDANSQKTLYGSPLISLLPDRHFTDWFFVELKAENMNALKVRCEKMTARGNLYYYQKDCNIAINEIIESINKQNGSSLTLAFIDPEGVEVHWNTIKVLSRLSKIDLLINFCDTGIMRNLENSSNWGENNCLDKYFGDTYWREIYNKYTQRDNMTKLRSELLSHYIENLKKLGFSHVSESPDTIRVKNENNAPLYRLLYASRHKLGNDFWKIAISKDNAGQMKLPLE